MKISFADYYAPKQKQRTAHRNTAPFLLFGGAMGGGKSWFLCAEAILNAMKYDGNRLVIVRKELTTIRKTILITFFKICPPEIIRTYNQQSSTVTFINGSTLIFMEANKSKDPLLNKIKGLEIGWAGIDEANEVDEQVFNILKTRLRWVLPNGTTPPYKIRLTTNPENCWLIPYFIESKDKNHVFIQSLTTDNYEEDSEYVKMLKDAYKYNPDLLARYLEGAWIFSSAPNQLITNELMDFLGNAVEKEANNQMISMGVDPARYGDDKTSFFILKGGRPIHIEEWSKTSIPEIVNRTIMLINDYNIQHWKVGVDVVGLGAGVVDYLHDKGIMVEPISSGEKPEVNIYSNEFKFLQPLNLRAQMFMALRNDIAGGYIGEIDKCVFITDGERQGIEKLNDLKRQMGWIKFTLESGKTLQILSKEKIKKEHGRSPDGADSFAIANWMRRREFTSTIGVI